MEINGVPRGNDQIMQWAIEKGQNDVQYTTQIIKDETTRTPLNTGGNAAAPEGLIYPTSHITFFLLILFVFNSALLCESYVSMEFNYKYCITQIYTILIVSFNCTNY